MTTTRRAILQALLAVPLVSLVPLVPHGWPRLCDADHADTIIDFGLPAEGGYMVPPGYACELLSAMREDLHGLGTDVPLGLLSTRVDG